MNINNKIYTLTGNDLFPDDEAKKSELLARANNYKNLQWEKLEVEKKEFYVKFKLSASSAFGITYQYINSVLDSVKLKKPPCSSPISCGVINRKGNLIPVLDVRSLLGIPTDKVFDHNQLIVIESKGMMAAIAVYSIDGDASFDESELLSPNFLGEIPAVRFSVGVHNGIVPIIDVKQLLSVIVKNNEDK